MPTYVYACDACGVQFEQFQRFSDEPLKVCHQCSKEGQLRRVFQPVGIVFKGSGWYVTDSRKVTAASIGDSDASASETKAANDNGSKTEKTEKTEATAEKAEKTETKAEPKPQTKAEPKAAEPSKSTAS